MTKDEFAHNIMIPIAQLQKVVLYRLEGYPEHKGMVTLFEKLNDHLNEEYHNKKKKIKRDFGPNISFCKQEEE